MESWKRAFILMIFMLMIVGYWVLYFPMIDAVTSILLTSLELLCGAGIVITLVRDHF